MDARSIKFIAKACGGEWLNATESHGSVLPLRVCTDSRLERAWDLFVAIAGERFDGHDFLRDVLKKGAAAVLVQTGKAPEDFKNCAVIAVDDTRKALARLAAAYRKDFE